MSVPVGVARTRNIGSGSTGPFAFNFVVYNQTHLRVVKTDLSGVDTALTLTTDYTVTLATDFSSATINMVAPVTGDGIDDGGSEILTITRDPPIEQPTEWPLNDPFPSRTHERAADLAVMMIGRLNEKVGRSLLLPESSPVSGLTLPNPVALKILRWNAAGTALENALATEIPDTLPPVSAPDARKAIVANAAGSGFEMVPRLQDADGKLTTTGAANAYAVATQTPFTAFAQIGRITAKLNFTNTGACTLNPDGLGARPIKKPDGTDPSSGELTSGSIRDFVNDGTNFQVLTIGGTPPDAVRLNANMVANLGAIPVGDGAGGAASRFRELAAGANGTVLEADSTVANVGVKWGNGGVVPRDIPDITAGDTVVVADRRKLIDIASGTGTLAFAAAATLGAQFSCMIRNKGSGDVTLDPNSTELIDGLANWILYPGGTVLVTCDGSAFRSVLLSGMRKQFDASSTFTTPGVGTEVEVEVIGGGGGGGRSANNAGSGGGGGGGRHAGRFSRSVLAATVTVTIGAAGAAGVAIPSNGGNGGATTFGALLSATGGIGGQQAGSPADAEGGAGGGPGTIAGTLSVPAPNAPAAGVIVAGVTPSYNSRRMGSGGALVDSSGCSAAPGGFEGMGGGGGGSNASTQLSAARAGGSSIFGGAGGGGVNGTVAAGAGGASEFAGAGGAAGINGGNAAAGTAPGGGGGAAEGAGAPGAGAVGRCIIWIR